MKGALPFFGMMLHQVTSIGVTVARKKAIETGMHNFSYIFYSTAFACLILLPATFIVHRSPNRPILTLPIIGAVLALGILAFVVQLVGYVGITYASITEATAITNLTPGFTIILAIIFRVERVDYGVLSTWAKIIGTLVSVVGALIVTFYTGPEIIKSHLTSLLIAPQGQSLDWIIGGVIILVECVLTAFFLVAQALILKKYSAVLILVLVYCSISAVLCILASLILEHDLNEFSLRSKTRLLAILYSGLFGVGFQATIVSWCMKMKGPHFVAMFHPLGIVVAAVMGVVFLGDDLYLGCLLGSIVIVIGFCGVIWAKTKEDITLEQNMVESAKSPLLV